MNLIGLTGGSALDWLGAAMQVDAAWGPGMNLTGLTVGGALGWFGAPIRVDAAVAA